MIASSPAFRGLHQPLRSLEARAAPDLTVWRCYYYRARYYDPVLKRFIAEDPVGIQAGVHFYAYVNGNPLSHTDPLGLQQFPLPSDPQSAARAMGCTLNPAACNGNYTPGFTPQDMVCTLPGAIGRAANSNKCVLACCQEHDACYERYGCNASSWNGNLSGGYSGVCQMCNAQTMKCIAQATVSCDNCPPDALTWTGAP